MAEKNNIWIEIIDDIVESFGGVDNINNVFHCATRLRVVVYDNDKVDKDKIKEINKVKGVNFSANQWQIIFGAGIVNKVFDNYNKKYGLSNDGGNDTNIQNVNNDEKWWNSEFSFWSNIWIIIRKSVRNFGDIFIPLIPAFIVGGISLAFASLLNTVTNVNSNEAAYAFYKIFDLIGGTVLGMLPVFVAWSFMKKLGGPEIYGVIIGLVLVSPALLNSWTVQAPIKIGLGVGDTIDSYAVSNNLINFDLNQIFFDGNWYGVGDIISFNDYDGNVVNYTLTINDINSYVAIVINNSEFGPEFIYGSIQNAGFTSTLSAAQSIVTSYTILFDSIPFFSISLIGYQAQIFSALLATILVYYLYKFFVKFIHESVAIIFVPLLTVVVATYLTLWIVGPIGRSINDGIAFIIQQTYFALNYAWFGFGAALIVAAMPFLVLTGLHQGLQAVELTILAETAARYGEGFSFITPLWVMMHMGQGAAVLTYALIVKNKKSRSVAVSGGVSVNLGISEPALFGTNLELFYPLVAGIIGSMFGAYWVGMTGTFANSLGSASWLGLVQFTPTATNAYKSYLSDNNISSILVNASPIFKIVFGMIITYIVSIPLTIIFSNTKWGKAKNKEVGIETLTYNEIYQMLSFNKLKKA